MTTYAQRPVISSSPAAPAPTAKGRLLVKWLTSTDHKTIGYLYLITSFQKWGTIAKDFDNSSVCCHCQTSLNQAFCKPGIYFACLRFLILVKESLLLTCQTVQLDATTHSQIAEIGNLTNKKASLSIQQWNSLALGKCTWLRNPISRYSLLGPRVQTCLGPYLGNELSVVVKKNISCAYYLSGYLDYPNIAFLSKV